MTAAGWFWLFYFSIAVTVLLWVTGCAHQTPVLNPPACLTAAEGVRAELIAGRWYCLVVREWSV